MLGNIEEVAMASRLQLTPRESWCYNECAPHVSTFAYDLARFDDETDDLSTVGRVDGYRIAQDLTAQSDLELWYEADAIDADAVAYVEALIRELRACELVFDMAPSLAMAERTTIVRHVATEGDGDSATLTLEAVASLAMMDAPVLMLVDPSAMSNERRTAAGKLVGRSHVAKLFEIGFVRMVGCRFVWAWNRSMSELLMSDYSYDALLEAKRDGALKDVLASRLADEVFGAMPDDVAETVGVPDPNKLVEE